MRPYALLSGPGFADSDVSLEKTTRIAESAALVIRVDTFDLLNHTNSANPNLTASGGATSTFGQIAATRHGNRRCGVFATTAVRDAVPVLAGRGRLAPATPAPMAALGKLPLNPTRKSSIWLYSLCDFRD